MLVVLFSTKGITVNGLFAFHRAGRIPISFRLNNLKLRNVAIASTTTTSLVTVAQHLRCWLSAGGENRNLGSGGTLRTISRVGSSVQLSLEPAACLEFQARQVVSACTFLILC